MTSQQSRAACGLALGFAALVAPVVPAQAASGVEGLLALCLASLPAVTPQSLWSSWSLAPEVVVPLAVLAGLYARGLIRMAAVGAGVALWQRLCFAAGWLALVVALVSPLWRMAATLAAAHMVQHVVLVAVAPPLLLAGAPGTVIRAALPAGWRRPRRPATNLSGSAAVLATGALYGVAIWLWHVPAFYEAALLDARLHLVQYAVLLGAAVLFWQAQIATAAEGCGGHATAVVVALLTAMHTGLLGALLTFSPALWYPLLSLQAPAWGLTLSDDQQLAGLIMWVPMGSIYVVTAVALMAVWLGAMERNDRRRA